MILDQMPDILLHSERRSGYSSDESLITTMNERVHLEHGRNGFGVVARDLCQGLDGLRLRCVDM